MTALSDDEIMELAGSWFYTGENQKRDDGYYYRSLGTPSNVRGSDLIEFARALLAAQPAVQQPAEDAPSDDELKDLAHSAYEEAMSFGLSVDTFLRYFKGIRNHAAIAAERKA